MNKCEPGIVKSIVFFNRLCLAVFLGAGVLVIFDIFPTKIEGYLASISIFSLGLGTVSGTVNAVANKSLPGGYWGIHRYEATHLNEKPIQFIFALLFLFSLGVALIVLAYFLGLYYMGK